MGGATPEDKELVLECQGSSVGKYSSQWLNEFHHSARGLRAWLDVPKARRAKAPLPGIKILFPTAQYVRESRLGEAVRVRFCAGFRYMRVVLTERRGCGRRAVGRCGAGASSGRARTFRGSCFTRRGASVARCSCTRRYAQTNAAVCG